MGTTTTLLGVAVGVGVFDGEAIGVADAVGVLDTSGVPSDRNTKYPTIATITITATIPIVLPIVS